MEIESPFYNEIMDSLKGESVAVMLYGSQARGTAKEHSDIDVLQLVSEGPRSYSVGRVSVAAYLPAHVKSMADSGSLFVRHLKEEGLIIEDPRGVLDRVLGSYRDPLDGYESLLGEISVCAGALYFAEKEFSEYGDAFVRLAVYLLRTVLYIKSIKNGKLNYDPDILHETSGDQRVEQALQLRRKRAGYSLENLIYVRRVLSDHLNFDRPDESMVFEAYAVSIALRSPYAASLLAGIISGGREINYTSLANPPM